MRGIAFLSAVLLLLVCALPGLSETDVVLAPKQIVVTFTGDCTLGCDPSLRGSPKSFESYIEKYGYEYPFANVKHIFEQDDLTVINLEGTFYNLDANLAPDKTYHFRGPTDFVNILTASSVEACSIGNNHILDYGVPGMQSTIDTLEGAGIHWFGTTEYCDGTFIYEKDGVRIGFYSIYYSDWVTTVKTAAKDSIQALKAAGHTVAMTGDGVNDVLALKDADCGVAMASGSEAACQAAQLVLLDSDFSAMPDVVAEGRRVINNIQRAASLFFVKNIFSFALTLISLFVDIPYPLVPLHLSVISGLTIGLPAFFLALEPNHERVKGRFITNVFLRALPGGITDLVLVLLIEAFVAVFDFPPEQLYTMSAVMLAVVGLRVLYQCAQPISDWKHWTLLLAMSLAELVCFTVLSPIFGFTAPTLESGLVLAVLLIVSFQVMRTVLNIFKASEQGLEKLRARRQARKEGALPDRPAA